jgi:hypothetical protein
VSEYRYFTVKKHKYVWDGELGSFYRALGIDNNIRLNLKVQPREGRGVGPQSGGGGV